MEFNSNLMQKSNVDMPKKGPQGIHLKHVITCWNNPAAQGPTRRALAEGCSASTPRILQARPTWANPIKSNFI